MRIGIDVRCLSTAKTGIRTFAEGLINALPKSASQHEYMLLKPKSVPLPARSALGKVAGHLSSLYWTQVQLPFLAYVNRCDVLLSLEYSTAIFATCPRIVVFHDANFWANPQQYNRWWRLMQNTFTLAGARRATRVITVSQFARREIASYSGIPLEHIVCIPEAAKPRSSTISRDDALLQHGLLGKTYILHVGVLEKRKNLPRLIEAFALCQARLDRPLHLVLAGPTGPKADLDDSAVIRATIERFEMKDRVRLLGLVPDEHIPALYQGSSLFAFPSKREGFGIPILEAFAYGTPVIAANCTAIPETAGDAALLVDPDDPHDIADAMLRLLSDVSLRADLIQKGLRRAKRFSWDRTAQLVARILEEVTEGHLPSRPS